MSTLTITRGLPGSGKSTWARAWVQESPETRIRLNRDEQRRMLHGDTGPTTNGLQENLITKLHHDAARQALRAGIDVVVDDTNLRGRTAADWATLAAVVCAGFEVQDFTDVPLADVLWRNAQRPEATRVPESVILTMNQKFLNGRPLPTPAARDAAPSEWTPYDPDMSLPSAYLVDIDGTVAIKGDRDIYDGSKAHLDTVNADVAAVVRILSSRGYRIIYMSGRSDEHREVTKQWLLKNDLPADELYMRAAGDHRKDSTVKHELFDKHVRHTHHVRGVFDDRNQVVEMWRAIGLTVFQVADGNF